MGSLDRTAYLRHRYGGSQRLVHRRELRLVDGLLAGLGPLECALDAPSGHGRLLSLLRARARWVTALDLDPRHLHALTAAENDPPPRLRADLARPLPFAEGSFDLVLCVRYLHHVRAPEARRALLTELRRVSRRYLLVSYYGGARLHLLQRALRRIARPGLARLGHVHPRALAALAGEVGLEVLCDRAILPGVHAQRFALLARTP